MLEQFLSHVYHPNRVVELMNTIQLLYRIGLTSYVDKIEEIMLAETGTEPEVMAGNIEASMVDGLLAGLTQYGVTINYDPGEIAVITDMLQFLAFWDTSDGSSPASFGELENIRELSDSNEDILIELFERSGNNHGDRLIDWIVTVSPSLINRLDESFKAKPVLSDEPSCIAVSSLNDFRLFAVHFPDSRAVEYIKGGGAIGLSLNTLLLANDDWFQVGNYKTTAIELVGLALMSDLPRENLKASMLAMIEPVIGSTLAGQNVIREVTTVFEKVLGK
jgi:hypothetical protein